MALERQRSIGGFLILSEKGEGTSASREYQYVFTDHLGSLDTLVNPQTGEKTKLSFDAHGSRRVTSGGGAWAHLLGASAITGLIQKTPRGFTGHEQIDDAGLIHMSGRLYDPLLGRMLSPDPIVQEPHNAQNLNRYTYVLNNPLSYTDPSGLSFVKNYWRQIVSIAVSVFTGPWAVGLWGAMAVGFVSGTIATGSLEGGLWGAFSAGVFHGIGGAFEAIGKANGADFSGVFGTSLTGPQFAGQVLSHATAGGVLSSLQGGKFGHGVASAGISKAATPGTAAIPTNYGRAMVHALIGGTASKVGGGKFANGAATAVMAFVFNSLAHEGQGEADYSAEEELQFDSEIDWSLIGDGDLLGKAGEDVLNSHGHLPKGHVTVLAHGGGRDTISDQRSLVPLAGPHGENLSNLQADRFSRMLQRKFPNLKPGMTAVLAACTVGGRSANGLSLAQGVANRQGVTVIAPDLWLRPNMATGAPDVVDKNTPGVMGRWVTHSPR